MNDTVTRRAWNEMERIRRSLLRLSGKQVTGRCYRLKENIPVNPAERDLPGREKTFRL